MVRFFVLRVNGQGVGETSAQFEQQAFCFKVQLPVYVIN